MSATMRCLSLVTAKPVGRFNLQPCESITEYRSPLDSLNTCNDKKIILSKKVTAFEEIQ
jgi:hypothetical protein